MGKLHTKRERHQLVEVQREAHVFKGRALHLGGDRTIAVSKTGTDAPLSGASIEGGCLMPENAAYATEFGSDGSAPATPSVTMRTANE